MGIAIQSFSKAKALEAIVFIASKVEKPTFHKVAKIFYFADKLHLERYGLMLSEDTYIAMENGPVPSRIYDMMKYAAGRTNSLSFAPGAYPKIREAMGVAGHHNIVAKRDPNLDYLSESEIECLEETIKQYGHKTFGQLTDESHDAAWDSVDENQPIPLKEIVKTLPNAKELAEYLYI